MEETDGRVCSAPEVHADALVSNMVYGQVARINNI